MMHFRKNKKWIFFFKKKTMESGQISRWNKGTGDKFSPGDIFCEIQTDKATVDFEAQDEGIVAKILAEAGSTEVKCGDPIMIVVQDEDDVAAFESYVAGATPNTIPSAAAPTPSAVEPAITASSTVSSPPSSPLGQSTTTSSSPAVSGKAVVASPLAFKLAKELGKDISVIMGTGPGGRIIADDVREYIPLSIATPVIATSESISSAPPPPSAAVAPPKVGEGFTDYPMVPSALEAAARLTQSKRNIPHYYLTIDLKLEPLLQLRQSLNESLTKQNKDVAQRHPISLNDLLIKAAACAMKSVPEANASWMDTFVRVYDNVDINVVVSGGYTPLIRNVNQKGLAQIGADFTTLADKAAEETLTVEECAVGTFTIVNLGSYGIKSAAPIILEPQACMLALGVAENRIIPKEKPTDGEIYQQSVMMTVTLSCDHRVVDGAVGAQWLSAFKSHVENPNTLLL
jgi:pyruvate dehydrogenase E2 component (dihydrolipoamide acetyltransferase)